MQSPLSKISFYADVCSSGRDLTHTGYGLASIGHVAEIARHQYIILLYSKSNLSDIEKRGNDLFKTDVGTRLRYALDFQYVLRCSQRKITYTYLVLLSSQFLDPTDPQPVPNYLCNHKHHLKSTLGPSTFLP